MLAVGVFDTHTQSRYSSDLTPTYQWAGIRVRNETVKSTNVTQEERQRGGGGTALTFPSNVLTYHHNQGMKEKYTEAFSTGGARASPRELAVKPDGGLKNV